MPKKPTARYYTDSDRYMGWNYVYRITLFGFKHWIQSGNYFLINDRRIDKQTPLDELITLIKEYKND